MKVQTIHPNNRYTNSDDDALFGLEVETIAAAVNVDTDVFDSHQSYYSALRVAKEIADEINQEIHKAFFSGRMSIVEDLEYGYDADGDFRKICKFEGEYSKITGELVLAKFEIYDDSYFETQWY